MQSRLEEIRATGTEVLAVSVDAPDITRDKLGSTGIEYPLLADPELALIDAYGLRHVNGGMDGSDIARPAVFLIDTAGRIAWREFTDNYRIRLRPQQLLDQIAALP